MPGLITFKVNIQTSLRLILHGTLAAFTLLLAISAALAQELECLTRTAARFSWMGKSDPYTLSAASPGVKADLDSFLYQFAYHYAHIVDSSIKSVDTKHLVFSPSCLNGDGSKSRNQILKGLSDGGIDVFTLWLRPCCSGTRYGKYGKQ